MKWSPPGRRKRGILKLTWAEGIRGLMGEKGLMEEDRNGKYHAPPPRASTSIAFTSEMCEVDPVTLAVH